MIEQAQDRMVCDYCGAIKPGIYLAIGAPTEVDWALIELTGKLACPDCCRRAIAEREQIVEKDLMHLES